jgi:triosephosphate isomerase
MADGMRTWIGTSWKMNKTLAEGRVFAEGLQGAAFDAPIQPFVIPPFTLVREVKAMLAGTGVKVGAQNMHWADAGAWTGEVSPLMLKDCGLDLVELGHSERREFFGETDERVGLKTEAAVRHGLVPLICIGETGAEKDAGRADEVLKRQVEGALGRVAGSTAEILLAYEPVWAIGEGGTPATPEDAQPVHAAIKRAIVDLVGIEPPVLYGGSVNPDNAQALAVVPEVDGLFVGRSAWTAEGLLGIAKLAVEARAQRRG